MTEHEQYHEITVDTLQSVEGLLREIAIISNASLGVVVVATAALIWTLNRHDK
jgi:hypothetical protein